MNENFGDRLKSAIQRRGLQQKQVAADCHLSEARLSSYTRGVSMPPLDVLVDLCEYLHISADYLLGLDGRLVPPFPTVRVPLPYSDLTEENQARLREYYDLLKLGQDQAKKGQSQAG